MRQAEFIPDVFIKHDSSIFRFPFFNHTYLHELGSILENRFLSNHAAELQHCNREHIEKIK